MTNDPIKNDPHILDGWDDGADLLGYEDDAGLMGWDSIVPPIKGLFDTSAHPLGGPVADRVFLLTATFQPSWGSQTMPMADRAAMATDNHPTMGFPFGAGAQPPAPVELRYADIDFTTAATDPDWPSVFFDGRVIDPGSVSFSLPLTPAGMVGKSFGRVAIDNTDGHFDTMLDQHSAISQAVRIRGGRKGAQVRDFVTVYDARITGIGMTETELTLELQDPVLYAQNLYPTTVYTGLGAAAGDPDLEGAVKPVVIGRVFNMSPTLVNQVYLIYQMHDGPIAAVNGVFDGGVPLTFVSDHPSYTSLIGASLSGGQYATSLAAGMIRVGGTPAFALTASLDGAAGTTVRSVSMWLATQVADHIGIPVSLGTFANLPDWPAGWVWNEAFTFADALNRFTADGGYHWGADTNGTIRALRLNAPGEPIAFYDPSDIMDIERAPLPQGYESPHQRRRVLYLRNWTPQNDSALAVTAMGRAGRQREWRTTIATTPSISRNAIDPPALETSLFNAADAANLASYLVNLHGVDRQMFSMETKIFGRIPRLGETVGVTYPRFGLAGGRALRVVASDLRLGEGVMNLLLWG